VSGLLTFVASLRLSLFYFQRTIPIESQNRREFVTYSRIDTLLIFREVSAILRISANIYAVKMIYQKKCFLSHRRKLFFELNLPPFNHLPRHATRNTPQPHFKNRRSPSPHLPWRFGLTKILTTKPRPGANRTGSFLHKTLSEGLFMAFPFEDHH
jgi:hypothetical protein